MHAHAYTYCILPFFLLELGAFRFKKNMKHGILSSGIPTSLLEVNKLMNDTFSLICFFLIQSELGSEKHNSHFIRAVFLVNSQEGTKGNKHFIAYRFL